MRKSNEMGKGAISSIFRIWNYIQIMKIMSAITFIVVFHLKSMKIC